MTLLATRVGNTGHLAMVGGRLISLVHSDDAAAVLERWAARNLDDDRLCTPELVAAAHASGWRVTPEDRSLIERRAAAATILNAVGDRMGHLGDLDALAGLVEAHAALIALPNEESHLFAFRARQKLSGPLAATIDCAGYLVLDAAWKLKLEVFSTEEELAHSRARLAAGDMPGAVEAQRIFVLARSAPPDLAEVLATAFDTRHSPDAFLVENDVQSPLPASCILPLTGLLHALHHVEVHRVKSVSQTIGVGDRILETTLEVTDYSLLE